MPKEFVQLPGVDVGPRLGKGAGAVIYSGVERASRRRVAIKHVVRRGPDDDRFLAQAENEYEVACKLDHRNLRKYYDLIRVRRWLKTSELFLIMEYVEGERLEDRYLERPDRFEAITSIFMEVCHALQAMHKGGFVHADMKPNNVMLTPDGGVKVIDFGQSCAMGAQKERVQGTPDYIAPEQLNREPLDQRTDIYNLGATMYRVTTGQAFATAFPVASLSAPGTRKSEVDGRRSNAPPHELNPAVPLALSKLIIECLERSRDQRPWDMGKVLSRLETVQHLLGMRGDLTAQGVRGLHESM